MLGEEEHSEEEGSFSKANVFTKIAVVVAGGLVNIIFGLLVYFILVSGSGYYGSNIVDEVVEQQTDYIQSGDKIIKINDKKIHLQSDISEELEKAKGNNVNLTIKRNDEIINVNIKPITEENRTTGIYFGIAEEDLSAKILALYPDSPAEKAGIEVNDIIIKVNGIDVNNDPYKAAELIYTSEGTDITFTVQRNNEIIDITLQPEIITDYYIGVVFKEAENNFINNIYYGFWDTVDFSSSIIDNLKEIFRGNVSTDQLMGPIGISEVVAQTNTIYDFVYILALISLSLGITNLLPFPPLDGGKVVIYIIEGIRKKPLKENIEIGIQMIGFVMLVGLSIYVAYNDILRIL